jgi:phage terminase large subunit-like protein
LSKNLAISPDPERPLYEPSKRRLTRPNGAVATTYSADEPERLRGPQHDAAWCDELAAWRYPEAWDMLMFGMRPGGDPRTVVPTTPRPASAAAAAAEQFRSGRVDHEICSIGDADDLSRHSLARCLDGSSSVASGKTSPSPQV